MLKTRKIERVRLGDAKRLTKVNPGKFAENLIQSSDIPVG